LPTACGASPARSAPAAPTFRARPSAVWWMSRTPSAATPSTPSS